jgi:outer membrane protein OmpA-like peptidoglycan-associated protein
MTTIAASFNQQRLQAGLCCVLLVLSPIAARAQRDKDVKGSKDHPMISRIPDSTLQGFEQKEFDTYQLVKGPLSGFAPDGKKREDLEQALDEENSLALEGRTWKLTYRVPANRSTLEIIRSYQTALTQAGFHILYQCGGIECAGSMPANPAAGSAARRGVHAGALSRLMMRRAGYNIAGDLYSEQHYLAGKLERPEGDIYAAVIALNFNRSIARVDVVEVKPLQANLVTVSAATMATEIAKRGSVALYGIYFDTDKTDVKPESRPTLGEIAALMKQDTQIALIVVGHTDSQGTIEYNLDLSRRRAEAVVAALATDFGIARNRLDARGVGFLAPVAPNTTERGRAQNRRVQLLPR